MLINEGLAKELAERFFNVCMEIVKDAHDFLKTHDINNLKSYYRYPISSVENFRNSATFNDEIKEKFHFFSMRYRNIICQRFQMA